MVTPPKRDLIAAVASAERLDWAIFPIALGGHFKEAGRTSSVAQAANDGFNHFDRPDQPLDATSVSGLGCRRIVE